MRASRRLMPTAEGLLKEFEYWVQGHDVEGAPEEYADRHVGMKGLRKSRKRTRLSLEPESQSRGHATVNTHRTMDHGTKALWSPKAAAHLPTATRTCSL